MYEKIVIFTMILTVIFDMVGYTAHSELDKKATENSSASAVIDTRQAEELTEKTENETVEKVPLLKKQHSHLLLKLVQKSYQKSRFFSNHNSKYRAEQDILIRKENRSKTKYRLLKSQQILFRKSQQQLNKLKNSIYRIGFLTHRIMLKVLALLSMKPQ